MAMSRWRPFIRRPRRRGRAAASKTVRQRQIVSRRVYSRSGRRHSVDEIEPALDAVEPAIDVIEPLLNGGIIQFDAGDLALDPAKPRHNLVELAINAVETIVETRETSAQKVENVVSLAHA